MESDPFVSIIMAVFNAEKYIATAIRSVLTQDYVNWELIVVNDGSTDKSKNIIHSFSDSRIKYFEKPNGGVSSARNVGLNNMQGDFFAFLDADDKFTFNSISSRIKVFEKNEEVSFVDGVVEVWDSQFANVVEVRKHSFRGNPLQALLEINPSCFFGPSWLIRRKSGVRYHFNENLQHAEDLLFYISISQDGLYEAVANSILYYRKGHLSAMSNIRGIWNGYWGVLEHLKEYQFIDNEGIRKFKMKTAMISMKTFLSCWMIVDFFKPFKVWIQAFLEKKINI